MIGSAITMARFLVGFPEMQEMITMLKIEDLSSSKVFKKPLKYLRTSTGLQCSMTSL